MSTAADYLNAPAQLPMTASIAEFIARFRADSASPTAIEWSKHALLDWAGVTIAGAHEPLVDMLIEEVAQSSDGSCSVVGRSGIKTSLLNAALINGASSHALDYDDVNRRLHGHPTVTVAPVALALGEYLNASGRDVLAAIIAGTEVACLIGEVAGDGHYEAGFHATGTIGTFGAAAAAAVMLKLDVPQTRYALGIAASQAAGLKANFGTMTKPLHAGKAAENGLLAARLAARGFTASDTILDGQGGIAAAMMPGFDASPSEPHSPTDYAIQQTLFKYHAACYLTHSTIEAVNLLRRQHDLSLDDVKLMTVKVRPSHFSVCNIPEPQTGLEIKFSIRHCAVLALAGVDTAALETYSDANALDSRYQQARSRTVVEGIDMDDRMAATVCIELNNGQQLEQSANVGIPATDLDMQRRRLFDKFSSLSVPRLGKARTDDIAQAIGSIDSSSSITSLMNLIR